MAEYWSLAIFTLLGQTAAGIMILLAFRRANVQRMVWLAIWLLAGAVLASLGHLSRPWLSPYSLINIGSSWLTREIWACIIFGCSMCACIIWPRHWLRCLSALLGIFMIYAMSRVYTIPTEPAWNIGWTFWNFLATGILLAASLLLLMDESGISGRDSGRCSSLGPAPFTVFAAMCFCVLFLFLQMTVSRPEARDDLLSSLILIGLGGGLGMLVLIRLAARLPVKQALSPGGTPATALIAGCSLISVCLIWVGELLGRAGFYKSYIWFGM